MGVLKVPFSRKIREELAVDLAIETTPGRMAEDQDPYDISRIDFDKLKKEFECCSSKRTTVQTLKQAVETRLRRLLKQNPLRTDFQQHYEATVAEYNREKDRVAIRTDFRRSIHTGAGAG